MQFSCNGQRGMEDFAKWEFAKWGCKGGYHFRGVTKKKPNVQQYTINKVTDS